MIAGNACELFYYQTRDGRRPFAQWVDSVTDPTVSAAIQARLARLQRNLLGDCKPVGEGVLELRVDVGAGYRAYIARAGRAVVLLLCGGDKRSQARDIRLAKGYWRDYAQRIRAAGGAG